MIGCSTARNGSTQVVFELIWKYMEIQNGFVVAAKCLVISESVYFLNQHFAWLDIFVGLLLVCVKHLFFVSSHSLSLTASNPKCTQPFCLCNNDG